MLVNECVRVAYLFVKSTEQVIDLSVPALNIKFAKHVEVAKRFISGGNINLAKPPFIWDWISTFIVIAKL